MNNNDELIQSLIAGGIIGAALGSLLSKKNEEGAEIGAIAGAVIMATMNANKRAQKTNVPVYVEENGNIYEVRPNGEKIFIKKVSKSNTRVPPKFKL